MNLRFSGFRDHNYMLNFDEQRFQQVLLNFQSNAIKFMHKEESGLQILVQLIKKKSHRSETEPQQHLFEKCVEEMYGSCEIIKRSTPNNSNLNNLKRAFQSDRRRDKILFAVMDNGIGVRDKDQRQLFQMFGTIKYTRKMNTKGVGLGLVICRMLSEQFGGFAQMFSKFE